MLNINPLSVISFTNIFSYSVGCLFVNGFFSVQKLLSLIRFHFVFFCFYLNSYHIYGLQYFLPFCRLPFYAVLISFDVQIFLICLKSSLSLSLSMPLVSY